MESTTTFTHSHRHASQVAYDPRWTPHRYWHHSLLWPTGHIDAGAAGSTEPLGGTRRGAGRQLAQFDDFAVVCDVTLTMPMSTALRRLMAAERPPTEAGDRTYRRRCGGIN